MAKIRIPKMAMAQIASGELVAKHGALDRKTYLGFRKHGLSHHEASYVMRKSLGQIKEPKRISKSPIRKLVRHRVKALRAKGMRP